MFCIVDEFYRIVTDFVWICVDFHSFHINLHFGATLIVEYFGWPALELTKCIRINSEPNTKTYTNIGRLVRKAEKHASYRPNNHQHARCLG